MAVTTTVEPINGNGKNASESDRGSEHVIGANRGPFSAMDYASREKSNKTDVQQVENVTSEDGKLVAITPKRSLFAKGWTHYKRWWICYTIGAIIFLAIFLPVLFLVIFPAIAQRVVDNANLPIWSARIMHPTPSTVDYSLIASLKVPPPLTVKLDPITLSLFIDDNNSNIVPYVNVDLPEYYLHGNTTVAITNQTAAILNKEIFESFLHNAVYSEHFMLSAAGATNAFLGKLKAHIRLDKSIVLAGLNKLNGFNIKTARAVLPPESDGTNLLANLTIPNASIVTFELGNVTLNLIMGGMILGNATIYNVLLEPGNNTVAARGIVDLKLALQNLGTILNSQITPLKSGNLELSASGNSTIYDGEHIDYYEKVLNGLTLTAQVPIVELLLDTLSGLFGTSSSSPSGLNLTSILNSTNITSILSGLTSLVGK